MVMLSAFTSLTMKELARQPTNAIKEWVCQHETKLSICMNLSSSNQLIRSCPGSALVFGNSSWRQGSRNCGILASGMGESGDRESKWEEKFHSQWLEIVFLYWTRIKMVQMKPKMDQKGLELVFFTKNAFFCGNFLCGTYAFVGNNSEWWQPRRKPHNFCYPGYRLHIFQFTIVLI